LRRAEEAVSRWEELSRKSLEEEERMDIIMRTSLVQPCAVVDEDEEEAEARMEREKWGSTGNKAI